MKFWNSMGSFTNSVINRLQGSGTGKDQGAYDHFTERTWLDNQTLSAMYRQGWMVKRIINVPANDILRQWREYSSDEDQQIKTWTLIEEKFKIKKRIIDALKLSRLYGGAALVPSIATDEEQYLKPFSINSFRADQFQGFKVFSSFDFINDQQSEIITDLMAPMYGWPEIFEIKHMINGKEKRFKLHSSWLIPIFGDRTLKQADNKSTRNHVNQSMWGISEIEPVYDDVLHAIKSLSETSTMLGKANIDYYAIPGLCDQIDKYGAEAAAAKMMEFMDIAKVAISSSNHHAVIGDAGDSELNIPGTDYKRFPLGNLSGFKDVANHLLQVLSAASGIPQTKLLGISPGGLNSTGDNELTNYYDDLAGDREDKLTEPINQIDSILSYVNTGKVDNIPFWTWRPLWQMSEDEIAEIEVKRAQRDQIYASTIELPFAQTHIAKQLAANGTYPYTDEQVAEISESEASFSELAGIIDDNAPVPEQ